MFDEARALGKVLADAAVQAPLWSVIGGIGAKDIHVLNALELVTVHGDHHFPVVTRGSLHADRDSLPRVRFPVELPRDNEALRIPRPEAHRGGVVSVENRKDDERRAVVAIGGLELEDVTKLCGPVKVRVAPPGRPVLEGVAGFLVRSETFDFRALPTRIVPVTVAVPPLVRLVAESHPHRVLADVGNVDEVVPLELSRDASDLGLFDALEALEARGRVDERLGGWPGTQGERCDRKERTFHKGLPSEQSGGRNSSDRRAGAKATRLS